MMKIEQLIQRPGIFKIPVEFHKNNPSKVMEICSEVLITKARFKDNSYFYEGYSERFEEAPSIITQHLPIYDLKINEDGSHEFNLNMLKTGYPKII